MRIKLVIYSVLITAICLHTCKLNAQAYTITTIIGSGTNGYSGDGDNAVNAELDNPCDIALDSVGNIYIADNGLNTNCIRKIDGSGIITTLLGGKTEDFAPDDDVIIDEENYPTALTVDATGNIYIVDKINNRARKLSKYGIITNIAGNGSIGLDGDNGPATDAALKHPTGITIDVFGNIYIADAGNNCIRKVNTNGVITQFAGTGTPGYTGDNGQASVAKLSYSIGVSADAAGNIYIIDEGNNCIRKVATDGIITTIAGNGRQGYGGDGGPATSASLGRPTGVCVDKQGNLYIADWFNNCIRKVDREGIISTVVGDGFAGNCGDGEKATKAEIALPYRVSVDRNNNLYIVDYGNHVIRKVNARGIISTIAGKGVRNYFGNGGPATAAEIFCPVGIAVDTAGNIYSSDKDGQRIHKTDAQGIISIIAGTGIKGYSGNGNHSEKAQLNSPLGLAADSAGNIYIADLGNNCIRKINTKGIISTVAGCKQNGFSGDGGPATAAKLSAPYSITLDKKGNMYIADYANHRIRKVNTQGVISTIAGMGSNGYSGDGGNATNAQLSFPAGIATDAAGNIYIADEGNNRIRKVNSNGIISTIAGHAMAGYSGDGGQAISSELSSPMGITTDANGNIFISDNGNNCIRMINTNGYIYTIAGDGYEGSCGNGCDAINAELNSPIGITLDAKGNIYIADNVNNEIRKLTPKAK